jgi:hypothetical protein
VTSKTRSAAIVLAILSTTCLVGPISADTMELAGGQTIVSALQTPGMWDRKQGAYYHPTGIDIGNKFYLYVQGGNWDHGPSGPGQGPCEGDKIFVFEADYTTQGMVTDMDFVRRISDCDGVPLQHSWSPGQVFRDGSQYWMTSSRSDQANFHTVVLGNSSDGINWTWQDFLRADYGGGDLEIHQPILVADPLRRIYCNPGCYSHHTWWGYFNFELPGFYWGTGRIVVDYSQQYPRGFRVKILSGGTWRIVDDWTGVVDFLPDDVWTGFNAKSLAWNVDHWELWGHKNVLHNGCAPCSGPYNNGFGGSTFTYREVSPTFFGPEQTVLQGFRCMPSDSHMGRLYPFRVNDPTGRKFLYSMTNDKDICTATTNEWVGAHVVVTELSN